MPAGVGSALPPGATGCNIEVNLDWVSVGWGVLFMLVADGLPFFRLGDADLSCVPPEGARLLPRGLTVGSGEVSSPLGME